MGFHLDKLRTPLAISYKKREGLKVGLADEYKLTLRKIMKFNIYLEDLNEEMIERIRQVLIYDLADEIDEAVESGINRNTAEAETIDDYLNTHNFRQEIEI